MIYDNKTPMGIRREDIFNTSQKSPLVHRFIEPQRILWQSEGVENSENLLQKKDPQIQILNTPNSCKIKTGNAPAGLLLDFGVEFQGYVKFYLRDCSLKRVKIRYRFGESAMEAMSEIGEKNATNDHITRDGVFEAGFLSMEEIGPSGFRFLRIDLLDLNAELTLFAIKGIMTYREIEYSGSFESNDERLNQIWATGAYTVHLCMQDYIWDGIKRDRLVWMGDMHPEITTIQAVFGYDESVPLSLDLMRDSYALPAFMNHFSASYSVWWILIHYSWYLQNGNKTYLAEQQEYMRELLKILMNFVGENGSEAIPGARFFDWPTREHAENTHAGLHGLLKMGFDAGAALMCELGEMHTAHLCEEASKKMATYIPSGCTDKQVAAFLALAGILSPKEACDTIIGKEGARGLSTFLGAYTMQIQAQAGDMEGALENIRTFWGAMIDRGATTFWEDFNIDWLEGSGRIDELVPEGTKDIHGDYGAFCYQGFRHSLCHGWASGVTAFLSNYVLGVKPIEAGCKTVEIKPNLGDLEWAKGTYPTPYGVITVKHSKKSDGSIETLIDAPNEVTVIQ